MKKIKKAVAIKYEHGKDIAPKIVAKGKGHIAEKIIEVARKNKVPLVEDQNLAKILETLDLEVEIPVELYHAVAEVLAFVYQLNREKRSTRPSETE